MKKIQKKKKKKINGASCTVYFPNDNRCEMLKQKNKCKCYSVKSDILRHIQNGNKGKSLQDKVAFYSSFRSLFS